MGLPKTPSVVAECVLFDPIWATHSRLRDGRLITLEVAESCVVVSRGMELHLPPVRNI